ncbi:MAG TPA: AraC family ligand binding domain-containing protein, partial [Phycisphaerales bacterium]|nr:AraC family ligand binding domain-containing protein [Phycisphaerales bacterium]
MIPAGSGWAQTAGGPRLDLRQGDVVWIPPGEKHWHGATATTAMTHIAIQERHGGGAVEWLEHVDDAQYLSAERPGCRPVHSPIPAPPPPSPLP